MSPTALTLALLRKEGWIADVVERWIPGANIHRDLFGFGDVLAAHPVLASILIIQATSLSNVASRLAKAKGKAELAAWLDAGGKFEVWGWGQVGGRWAPRRIEVSAGSLDARDLTPRRRGRKPKPSPGLFDG